MTTPTQPRNTVGAMLDALGFDRTDHDGAVRAALEEFSLLRADVERLRTALTEIRDRCRNCRCGYSPCGCGAYAEDVSDAALQPQTRGER